MAGLLGALFPFVFKEVLKRLLPDLVGLVTQYQQGQITMAELEARTQEKALVAFQAVEVSHAESITSTYATFMDAAKDQPLLRRVWGATAISQLFVLFWYQWIVPFGHWQGWWDPYPNPGETIVWAYALLGGLLGFGAMMLRAGPGAGGVVNNLKSILGR